MIPENVARRIYVAAQVIAVAVVVLLMVNPVVGFAK